ncbi:MAG TPA: chromate transporter [Ideonella sp.]|nr:chromate transporter [Ideonella sp.]
MAADEPLRRPRSPGELFRVFNRLALQGFGGVLPVAQHHLVERERWLTKEDFVELLSIGQVLPGPNIVNLALMFGDRHFGWRGAFAALSGMLALPMALVLAAAALYARFAAVPAVAGALRGMGAVAAGLVLATALRLAPALERGALGRKLGYPVGLLTFVAIGLLHWPLVWIVLGLGGASCALAWWRLASSR